VAIHRSLDQKCQPQSAGIQKLVKGDVEVFREPAARLPWLQGETAQNVARPQKTPSMAANNRRHSRLRVCVNLRMRLHRPAPAAAAGDSLPAHAGEARHSDPRSAYGHTTVWVGLHFGAALTTMILVHQLS